MAAALSRFEDIRQTNALKYRVYSVLKPLCTDDDIKSKICDIIVDMVICRDICAAYYYVNFIKELKGYYTKTDIINIDIEDIKKMWNLSRFEMLSKLLKREKSIINSVTLVEKHIAPFIDRL